MICWNNKRDSLICGIYLKKKKEEISKKHRVGRNQVAPKKSVEEIDLNFGSLVCPSSSDPAVFHYKVLKDLDTKMSSLPVILRKDGTGGIVCQTLRE